MTLFPGFASRKIRTSGASIHLRTKGQGAPVLLLHGYPQTHAMWHKVAPELSHEYTVVCPDLRGYGDSSSPGACPITPITPSARWRSTWPR
jgi:haloacetate dehalogenase